MTDQEHTLVSGMLQKPSRIELTLKLQQEHFTDKQTQALFLYAHRYRSKRGRGQSPDIPLMKTLLGRSKSKSATQLIEVVEEYAETEPVSDAEFRDALIGVVEARRRSLIKDHGAAALEATLDGEWKDAEKELRHALDAAEDDIDDDQPTDIRSRAEIQRERELILSKPDPKLKSFDVGFPLITNRVSLRRTELTILGGYAADGKTHFSKTLVYNANQRSRARVLFVALEMEKREMIALFLAQHAASIDPRGVRYSAILEGDATTREKKLYLKALEDFEITSHDDGAKVETERAALHIWAPRRQITMKNFISRAKAMNQDEGLDIVVADYLELIQPSQKFGQYRLNVKGMCEQAKAMSREEKLWTILNHQISRGGRDAAEKRSPKHYKVRDLGESSGVERAADHVIWVYSDEDLKNDREAKVGIAKARKGKTLISGEYVYADYPKGIMGEITRQQDEEE